mmetsp:Transcript_14483/g.35092  ORF Transcript_14483/g.35092 Transcript_14483/m.35092 type:complete len:649 (-) Transcript_14483:1056-3002(-)
MSVVSSGQQSDITRSSAITRSSGITVRHTNNDNFNDNNKMPPRAGLMSSFGGGSGSNKNTSNGSPSTTNNKTPSSSSSPPSSSSRAAANDREITNYIQKLTRYKDDPKAQVDILSKLRAVLQQRVQKQSQIADLGVVLGPSIVDVMRQNPTNEELIEESTCNLYLLSILDPTFKKGVARLFKAMEDHRDNVAIQRAACAAIRRVISKNPDAIPRIVPSVGVILRSMAEHPQNAKFLCSALEVLAIIASHPPAKAIFVYRDGALHQVTAAMKNHPNDLSIQATALRTLSNLSYGSGSDITTSFGPAVTLIVRAMKRHIMHAKVQLYGCCTLHYIAPVHYKAIAESYGIHTLVAAMKEYSHDIMLQEQGCAAIHVVLRDGDSADDVETFMNEEGLPLVLNAMLQNPQNTELHKHGLGVLGCLKTKDNYEILLSEGGLDLIIADMNAIEDVGIAAKCCEILKTFTRLSLDFQRAVSAKGGIGLVLATMRKHAQTYEVQDAGFACMRNLCLHQDNRSLVEEEGGISTLLTHMNIYLKDAAIQAYGCDALGRLASETKNQITIASENGVEESLKAMREHPGHPGVQDRVCFLLLAMTEYPPAVVTMNEKQAVPTLREARNRIPPKEAAKERLENLISRLENSEKKWFGGAARR